MEGRPEQLDRVPDNISLPPRSVDTSCVQVRVKQYREPKKTFLSVTEDVSNSRLTTQVFVEINKSQVPGSEQEPLVDRLLTCTVQVPLGTELPSKALPATIKTAKSKSASGTQNTSQVSTETLKLKAEKSNNDMAIVQKIADSLVRRAQKMSEESLHDLAENLLAQEKMRKEGPPKAAKYPVWDNPGVRRGAIIRMPVIQQAFDPNTKEDRRRFVVGNGWADVSRRLVIAYCVSRTDMIVGVVTTRSGRGAADLTDRDHGLWGALWENGNAKMKREDVGVTVNAQMLHGFRGNISKRSVFKLYGTPMILPANYMVEGYLTKESCDLLPLPDGYNNYGWIHGYETVTPQITLEPPEPYHDVDQPALQEEIALTYDGQMTDHSPQNSNVDSCEDPAKPRSSHSRKRDRSPGVGPSNKRLRRLSSKR